VTSIHLQRKQTQPMPPSLRHRAQARDQDDTDSEIELSFGGHRGSGPNNMEEEEEEDMDGELVGEDGEEDDEALAAPHTPLPNLEPPPSYLREISTLASWTVSSSKPGCSIPQLRHPSTSLFWQSDGPQPHYLNIHFFKLVRIVGLRLYLDFEQDESYTPTRIIFLAGSGMNDLQEWGEMKLESPRGWVWADFSNVGDPDSDGEEEDDEEEDQRMIDQPPPDIENGPPGAIDASSDSENNNPQQRHRGGNHTHQTPQHQTPQHTHQHTYLPHTHTPIFTPTHTQATPTLTRPTPRLPFAALSSNAQPQTQPRRPRMPVLRAHLVQIKILENHQNGKDTHLRGLQIFARNDEKEMMAVRSMAGKVGGGGGGDVGLTTRNGALERYELGGFDEGGIR
jgi:anaphase-promoting complex subunit 10